MISVADILMIAVAAVAVLWCLGLTVYAVASNRRAREVSMLRLGEGFAVALRGGGEEAGRKTQV